MTFMQRSAGDNFKEVCMCSADAATLDCNRGTILGRDVVPDVCNISAMSSAVGSLVAGVAAISDDKVK